MQLVALPAGSLSLKISLPLCRSFGAPSYHVQALFAKYEGKKYLQTDVRGAAAAGSVAASAVCLDLHCQAVSLKVLMAGTAVQATRKAASFSFSLGPTISEFPEPNGFCAIVLNDSPSRRLSRDLDAASLSPTVSCPLGAGWVAPFSACFVSPYRPSEMLLASSLTASPSSGPLLTVALWLMSLH